MLYHLPFDIYSIIVKYLLPNEFQQLYVAFNNKIIRKYFKQHCVVECKTIIADEMVNWFEQNGVKVQLLRKYKTFQGKHWWQTEKCDIKMYSTNGKLHSENDEPAHIEQNGTYFKKCWYKHGKMHRDHGPAYIINNDGDGSGVIFSRNNIKAHAEAWFQNGKKHRDNGPAVIRSDGQVMYFQHGKLMK